MAIDATFLVGGSQGGWYGDPLTMTFYVQDRPVYELTVGRDVSESGDGSARWVIACAPTQAL